MPRPFYGTVRQQTSRAALMALCTGTMLALLMAFTPASSVLAVQVDLSALPVSFPVQSPEVAAYFGEIAREGDIASVSPDSLDLVTGSASGQVMVAFRSWADAEQQLGALSDKAGWVMYNPENWELTPGDEKQELGTVVQRAAEFAHTSGLRFMFAPDRQFAEQYLTEVAAYIDAVLLQGQRLQADPQVFSSWVLDMTQAAREVNPDMLIYVQVAATRGPAAEMYAAIQTVGNEIDGIAIWSMPRSLGVLREFVTMLREQPPVSTPTAVSSPTMAFPTPAPTRTSTPTPTATATRRDEQPTRAPEASVTGTPISIAAVPTHTSAPTSTPSAGRGGPSLVETPAPAVTATASTLSPAQREGRTREALKDIGLVVASVSIGLLVGFGLGRRKHGSDL
jgi:hypothetical protein